MSLLKRKRDEEAINELVQRSIKNENERMEYKGKVATCTNDIIAIMYAELGDDQGLSVAQAKEVLKNVDYFLESSARIIKVSQK